MTIAKITPSIGQIRFHAQAALNAFETLDLETATEVAQGELQTLLRYLDIEEWPSANVIVNFKEDEVVFELMPAAPPDTQEDEKR